MKTDFKSGPVSKPGLTLHLILVVAVSLLNGRVMADPEGTTYRLYYLGGQSNMEGFGFSEELPASALGPSLNVMILPDKWASITRRMQGSGYGNPCSPGLAPASRQTA